MNTPESVKIKQARKAILRNLDLVYPSGLTITSLYQSVCAIDPLYDFNLFAKDVEYLRAKKYLFFIDEAIGGLAEYKKKTAKLTPQGKEIAEQTASDPALEI